MTTVHRHAGTGRFVSQEYADRHPRTTVAEDLDDQETEAIIIEHEKLRVVLGALQRLTRYAVPECCFDPTAGDTPIPALRGSEVDETIHRHMHADTGPEDLPASSGED